MHAILLGAVLAAAGWAAPIKPETRPGGTPDASDQTALIAHAPEQWLKVYPLPINREVWRLEITVQSLDKDLPRVREAFSKQGAALAGAKESSGKTWRLDYRCPKESAQRALAELRKIGSFGEPAVRQFTEPVSRAEVQGKIQALEADKAGHGAELAKMPAAAALVEELLGHLRGVESALRKPEVEVLVHLTVKEKNGS